MAKGLSSSPQELLGFPSRIVALDYHLERCPAPDADMLSQKRSPRGIGPQISSSLNPPPPPSHHFERLRPSTPWFRSETFPVALALAAPSAVPAISASGKEDRGGLLKSLALC